MKRFVAHWDRALALVLGFGIGMLVVTAGAQADKVIAPVAAGAFSWPGCAIWTVLLYRREISSTIRRLRTFEIGKNHIEGTIAPSDEADANNLASAPPTNVANPRLNRWLCVPARRADTTLASRNTGIVRTEAGVTHVRGQSAD